MKYIKLFEDYITDEDRGKDATFDHSKNPVLRQQAKAYVDSLLHSNQYKIIFDALDLEAPKNVSSDELDAMFDDIAEKAVDFFVKNPERMTETPDSKEVKQMAVSGGNTGDALTRNTPTITHT